MSPRFLFKINEIFENPTAPIVYNSKGHWEPSASEGASSRHPSGVGVTGVYWYCDGQQISRYQHPQFPQGTKCHHSFSMYYCEGYGFWVLHGDATESPDGPWRPLTFEHDTLNYSSYLTNAGTQHTLRCQRLDQQWPRMLLPDIYQAQPANIDKSYGGLKGDLGILLALIAFSMSREDLQRYLHTMFRGGRWQAHGLPNGRLNKRGVVVNVYRTLGTTVEEMTAYENGQYGLYYN